MHTGTMYNEDKLNALIQWNEQKKSGTGYKTGESNGMRARNSQIS